MRNLIAILILFSIQAHADGLHAVKRQSADNGQNQLCFNVTDREKGLVNECLVVQSIVGGMELQSTDSTLKTTRINLVEFSLDSKSVVQNRRRFAAVVEWEGKGSGTLSISGPHGKMYAVGQVIVAGEKGSPNKIEIEQFDDESMIQQFDRSTFFGEVDSLALQVKTKLWLEEILLPAVEHYLSIDLKVNSLP